MASSTRERLLEAAEDLFYREGFHTVGLDRILAEAGVTKTTFYNHFESKEHLMQDVLRHHDRWWRETFIAILRKHGGDDPRGQLLALPDLAEEIFAGDDYNGCFFINVAVEFRLPHDPAHVAASEHKMQMAMILRDLSLRMGASDPVALAEELCLALEGAYVTSQITPGPAAVAALRRLVEAAVERYAPVQAGSASRT